MQPASENLGEMLDGVLPVPLRHIPLRIRDAARSIDVDAALAGGIPRDLLRVRHGQLPREQFMAAVHDVDLVVAGPVDPVVGGAGVRYAYELARRLPGKLAINPAFHTATLTTAEGINIDVTTARREHYPSPGQLPEVDISGVGIAEDLNRRDFAVNALALDVSNDYGRLIDVCGGAGDIRDRQIRVLHSASFTDDPTRVFRAIRYSVRLGYELEPTTEAQLEHAVDEAVFDCLTPERIRYELECIGQEERWLEMWAALDIFRIARAVIAGLNDYSSSWNTGDARSLDIALRNQTGLLAAEDAEPWLIRTAWVLSAVSAPDLHAVCERLGLYKRHCNWLEGSRLALSREAAWLIDDPSPREVCQRLERYSRQALLVAMFIFQPRTQEEVSARRQLRRYLEDYSSVRCELNGHELMALGLKPGPLVGRIRDELRYLRLDGVITSSEEERQYAGELVRRWTRSGNGQGVLPDAGGGGSATNAGAGETIADQEIDQSGSTEDQE